ncbi:MAG: hypothetical protein ABJA89_12185 [Lapillicoccus sp.]
MLFQVITVREERASNAIATNLPFCEWGTVFPDPASSPPWSTEHLQGPHPPDRQQVLQLRTSKTRTRRTR